MAAKNNKVNISILGSCVCRDLFEIPNSRTGENGNYIIDRFVQSINPISAVSDVIDNAVSTLIFNHINESTTSNFYKKIFTLEIKKKVFDYLNEVKSDFIIIDITTCRNILLKIKDSYLTLGLANEVLHSIENDEIKSLLKLERLDILDMSQTEFEKLMDNYFANILSMYNQNKIIIIDILHTFIFLGDKHEVKYLNNKMENEYILQNKRIERALIYLKKKIPNAHYIDRLPCLVGNINHKWGMCGMHYINDVYNYLFASVDFIINNSVNKSCEINELNKIKDYYGKVIFEKYNNEIIAKLKAINNLIIPNNGMSVGKWEKNGISLQVDNEYKFYINGISNEDTVFYLYSGHKNPLGKWMSSKFQLPKGKYSFASNCDISSDTFYIQMVLSNSEEDRKWIWGSRYYEFETEKDYKYALIRIIIKKGIKVDAEGEVHLEKIN